MVKYFLGLANNWNENIFFCNRNFLDDSLQKGVVKKKNVYFTEKLIIYLRKYEKTES